MRYLFLLLGEEGALSLSEISGSSRYAGAGNGGFHADIPMLEALVKALERAPEKIDQVCPSGDRSPEHRGRESASPGRV